MPQGADRTAAIETHSRGSVIPGPAAELPEAGAPRPRGRLGCGQDAVLVASLRAATLRRDPPGVRRGDRQAADRERRQGRRDERRGAVPAPAPQLGAAEGEHPCHRLAGNSCRRRVGSLGARVRRGARAGPGRRAAGRGRGPAGVPRRPQQRAPLEPGARPARREGSHGRPVQDPLQLLRTRHCDM